ncbi:MAG: hypothetical protein H6754_03770 [Candidatus Omnitrophica bacterium]|nr:hypothetical protein [Candidatus Omnitrophota bacterium]
MTAIRKMWFFFVLLCFLFFAGLFLYLRMEHKHLLKMQQIAIQEKKISFEKVLKLNQRAIFVLANDYSYWDELVTAIKNEDVQWAWINIDSGIKTYQADAAWIYNMDFKRIYSVNKYADDRLKELPLDKSQIEQIFGAQALVHFYVQTPAGYLEIQGATVHSSDDSERKTPSQGYFFVAKLWDKEYLKTLSQLTDIEVSVIAPKDVAAVSSRADAFTVSVYDWRKAPLFTIVGVIKSDGIDHFQTHSRIFLKMFLVYTVMQMLFMLYFLRRLFRTPRNIS